MKHLYLLLFSVLSLSQSYGQISIVQNDMPHSGDTARYTVAANNPFLNYNATGPNHTWNFSNLRAASQGLQEYKSVNSTNFLFALVFSNLPFNPNRSSVASTTTEPPTNQLIPLTNPVNFYYLSSSVYQQTGFGAEISNFPTPVAYNNKDIIYHLPLNYGDRDTSDSDWNIGLPGVGYMGYTQRRINNVDGWGTLVTPYDTFDVVRVKTTRAQADTIALDTLGGFALPRALVTEYKWLANNEIIPVMQVNTQTFFGLEIITEILFRDDFIRIQTDQLAEQIYCAGSPIQVPYTKYGTFNGPAIFSQANVFTAQLSDASGDFSNAVNIGSVTSNQSGVINATLPAGLPFGTHYRIRVVSTNLPVTGADNGADITILNSPPAASVLSASGASQFCAGNSVTLSVPSQQYASYQWLNNDVIIAGASDTVYDAASSGLYQAELVNVCGSTLSDSILVIVDTLPSVEIVNLVIGPFCNGDTVLLNSIAVNSTSLQWQVNGSDISGEINPDLAVLADGIFTLNASNYCGSVVSDPVQITFGSAPVLNLLTTTGGFCQNDSVLLEAFADSSSILEWQYNGTAIPGSVYPSIYASLHGNYTVSATNGCGQVLSDSIVVTQYPGPGSPVIIRNGDTLSVASASTYQWYLNGVLIPGATNQDYIPSQSGFYSVQVTDGNGCSGASSEYAFSGTGLSHASAAGHLNIYPNPASDNLFISAVKGVEIRSVEIISMLGETVLNLKGSSAGTLTLPVSQLAQGIYTIRVSTSDSGYTAFFVKN